VTNLDDWAEIRHLFSTGNRSKRVIGRLVGVSRETVERALESDRAPKYRRPTGVSSFDAFAPKVRGLLVKTPTSRPRPWRSGWDGPVPRRCFGRRSLRSELHREGAVLDGELAGEPELVGTSISADGTEDHSGELLDVEEVRALHVRVPVVIV
jgi:hypothetical protein